MTIKRRNHGSGHSYLIDGQKCAGVTSILSMVPKNALVDWAGRTTAEYAIDHWADLAEARPSERLARLNRARFAERDAAARRGTQVHRLAEGLAVGDSVDVPEELAGHVHAYTDFLDRVDPDPVAVELVVAHRGSDAIAEPGYCGTADLIADLPALSIRGERVQPARWLLDIKTSRSGIFRETALQLCAYQRAHVYTRGDDAEYPIADLGIERAGAIHVRSDGWDLIPVDTTDDVWSYFCHLAWLYSREEYSQAWIGSPIDPPARIEATA